MRTEGMAEFAKMKNGGKAGFTLVEVIVVIVIIAILAAIGVPALTGYIDKAQDKKWELQTRDLAQAMRSVYADAYADGTLGGNSNSTYYMQNGNMTLSKIKTFDAWTMGNHATGNEDGGIYLHRAWALTGLEAPSVFDFVAPKDDSYNILNAPAFFSITYPEGNVNADSPVIFVTYGFDGPIPATTKLSGANGFEQTILKNNWACDANAGYQVFHLTKGS